MAYTVYYNTPGTILTYAQMQAELTSLASANSWTYIDCGDSAQGNEIGGIVVGGGSYTKTVLVTACIHGLEKPAARGALDFLNYIAANPSVFSGIRFVVVPIMNPDGYILNQRKNDNGLTDDDLDPWPRSVDLNRNLSRFWGGTNSSTNPAAGTYCGPEGLSEPETQALNALMVTYEPDLYFDLHTALNQIMAGWPNYAPIKAAVDSAMTANEFTPYPWVMNYQDGTTVSQAESYGIEGYLLEFSSGEIHYEVNRCICALKTVIESHGVVTCDSMNNFSEDTNCVAWLRFNSGYYSTNAGQDWLEKNSFDCLNNTPSSSIKVEGDSAVGYAAYPRILDANLSADFPFKYGTANKILGLTGWYYLSALPASGAWVYLASKYDTANKRSFGLVIHNNSGTYELRALIGYNSGANYQAYTLCTFDSLSANTWLFYGIGYDDADRSWYAAIYDESGFIDDGSGAFDYSIYLVDTPWALGCFHANNTRSGTAVAVGYIDETAFFKEKLSSTKIAAIWAQKYAARTGTLAQTLASAALSATGTVSTASQDISGTLAATLANSTSSSSGAVAIAGSLAQTLASATISASTSSGLSGALASTLADATGAATGTAAITGSLAAALASATVAGSGTVAVSGSLASTLSDASLSSGSSSSAIGALTSTLQSATISATGTVPIIGSASATLADATLSAYFGDSTPAQLSSTLASATVAASGEVAVMAALSSALQDAFASGSGTVDIDAECAATLADCFGVIAGRVAIVGCGSATLAGATLSARAGANLVPDAHPSRIVRVARENRIVRA